MKPLVGVVGWAVIAGAILPGVLALSQGRFPFGSVIVLPVIAAFYLGKFVARLEVAA